MKRRVILASCLLGIVGAGASTAFAAGPDNAHGNDHQVCIVTSSDNNHRYTQDYCVAINLPRVPPLPTLP